MAATPKAAAKVAASEADEAMNKAFMQCLRLLFDVPAVLRRQKPWSALVGATEVGGVVLGVISSSLVMDQWNELRCQIAATIYMRRMADFRWQTAQLVVVMMTYSVLSQVTSSLYLRLAQQWRRALTRLLHEKCEYTGNPRHNLINSSLRDCLCFFLDIRGQSYYQLQLAGQTDSDQRICADISTVTTQLASATYNGFHCTHTRTCNHHHDPISRVVSTKFPGRETACVCLMLKPMDFIQKTLNCILKLVFSRHVLWYHSSRTAGVAGAGQLRLLLFELGLFRPTRAGPRLYH